MLRRHTDLSNFVGVPLLLILCWIGLALPCQASMIDLTPTVGTNSIDSVSLGSLVTGQTMGILVGDKIFSGFSYSRIGDMPQASDILVLGFKDPAGNWGISLHGAFLDLPGGSASDALVRFSVEVDPAALQQGLRITDAHLYMSGAGVGTNSAIAIDESFLQNNQSLSTHLSSINGGSQQLSNWVDFDAPWTKLTVTKDILAIADANSTLPARVTAIDQSFSQMLSEVPETTTLTLAMIGVVGLGLFMRQCDVTKRKRETVCPATGATWLPPLKGGCVLVPVMRNHPLDQ
jgi:D-ribose pyranose/furanose isomerase RbsD